MATPENPWRNELPPPPEDGGWGTPTELPPEPVTTKTTQYVQTMLGEDNVMQRTSDALWGTTRFGDAPRAEAVSIDLQESIEKLAEFNLKERAKNEGVKAIPPQWRREEYIKADQEMRKRISDRTNTVESPGMQTLGILNTDASGVHQAIQDWTKGASLAREREGAGEAARDMATMAVTGGLSTTYKRLQGDKEGIKEDYLNLLDQVPTSLRWIVAPAAAAYVGVNHELTGPEGELAYHEGSPLGMLDWAGRVSVGTAVLSTAADGWGTDEQLKSIERGEDVIDLVQKLSAQDDGDMPTNINEALAAVVNRTTAGAGTLWNLVSDVGLEPMRLTEDAFREAGDLAAQAGNAVGLVSDQTAAEYSTDTTQTIADRWATIRDETIENLAGLGTGEVSDRARRNGDLLMGLGVAFIDLDLLTAGTAGGGKLYNVGKAIGKATPGLRMLTEVNTMSRGEAVLEASLKSLDDAEAQYHAARRAGDEAAVEAAEQAMDQSIADALRMLDEEVGYGASRSLSSNMMMRAGSSQQLARHNVSGAAGVLKQMKEVGKEIEEGVEGLRRVGGLEDEAVGGVLNARQAAAKETAESLLEYGTARIVHHELREMLKAANRMPSIDTVRKGPTNPAKVAEAAGKLGDKMSEFIQVVKTRTPDDLPRAAKSFDELAMEVSEAAQEFSKYHPDIVRKELTALVEKAEEAVVNARKNAQTIEAKYLDKSKKASPMAPHPDNVDKNPLAAQIGPDGEILDPFAHISVSKLDAHLNGVLRTQSLGTAARNAAAARSAMTDMRDAYKGAKNGVLDQMPPEYAHMMNMTKRDMSMWADAPIVSGYSNAYRGRVVINDIGKSLEDLPVVGKYVTNALDLLDQNAAAIQKGVETFQKVTRVVDSDAKKPWMTSSEDVMNTFATIDRTSKLQMSTWLKKVDAAPAEEKHLVALRLLDEKGDTDAVGRVLNRQTTTWERAFPMLAAMAGVGNEASATGAKAKKVLRAKKRKARMQRKKGTVTKAQAEDVPFSDLPIALQSVVNLAWRSRGTQPDKAATKAFQDEMLKWIRDAYRGHAAGDKVFHTTKEFYDELLKKAAGVQLPMSGKAKIDLGLSEQQSLNNKLRDVTNFSMAIMQADDYRRLSDRLQLMMDGPTRDEMAAFYRLGNGEFTKVGDDFLKATELMDRLGLPTNLVKQSRLYGNDLKAGMRMFATDNTVHVMPARWVQMMDEKYRGIVKSLDAASAESIGAATSTWMGVWRKFATMIHKTMLAGYLMPSPRYFINNAIGNVLQAGFEHGWQAAMATGSGPFSRTAESYNNFVDALTTMTDGKLRLPPIGLSFTKDTISLIDPKFVKKGDKIAGYEMDYLVKTAHEEGVLTSFMSSTGMKELAPRGTSGDIKLPLLPEGWKGFGERSEKWMEMAEAMEQHQRAALYLHMIRKGDTPQAAARKVKEALYDWDAPLSSFDKFLSDNVFMFWRYQRKALSQGLTHLTSAFHAGREADTWEDALKGAYNSQLARTVRYRRMTQAYSEENVTEDDPYAGVIPSWATQSIGRMTGFGNRKMTKEMAEYQAAITGRENTHTAYMTMAPASFEAQTLVALFAAATMRTTKGDFNGWDAMLEHVVEMGGPFTSVVGEKAFSMLGYTKDFDAPNWKKKVTNPAESILLADAALYRIFGTRLVTPRRDLMEQHNTKHMVYEVDPAFDELANLLPIIGDIGREAKAYDRARVGAGPDATAFEVLTEYAQQKVVKEYAHNPEKSTEFLEKALKRDVSPPGGTTTSSSGGRPKRPQRPKRPGRPKRPQR